jgi:hypothetical protein
MSSCIRGRRHRPAAGRRSRRVSSGKTVDAVIALCPRELSAWPDAVQRRLGAIDRKLPRCADLFAVYKQYPTTSPDERFGNATKNATARITQGRAPVDAGCNDGGGGRDGRSIGLATGRRGRRNCPGRACYSKQPPARIREGLRRPTYVGASDRPVLGAVRHR